MCQNFGSFNGANQSFHIPTQESNWASGIVHQVRLIYKRGGHKPKKKKKKFQKEKLIGEKPTIPPPPHPEHHSISSLHSQTMEAEHQNSGTYDAQKLYLFPSMSYEVTPEHME